MTSLAPPSPTRATSIPVERTTNFAPPSRTHGGSYHWAFGHLSAALVPFTGVEFVTSTSAFPRLDGIFNIALVHGHIEVSTSPATSLLCLQFVSLSVC